MLSYRECKNFTVTTKTANINNVSYIRKKVRAKFYFREGNSPDR